MDAARDQELDLPILDEDAGQTSCAELLAEVLRGTPGVRSAEIDWPHRALTLRYDPRTVPLPAVQKVAERLGVELGRRFDACLLRVSGVRCAQCSALSQARLESLPGITRVAVNPVAEIVGVEGETAALADLAVLRQRLGPLAADARPAPRTPAEFRAAEREEAVVRLRKAILTALCLTGVLAGWTAERWLGAPFPVVLACYLVGYAAGAFYALRDAWRELRAGEIDIDLLMLLGATGAAALGQWSEGGVLLFLFSLSGTLEEYVLARSRRAIAALMDLAPEEALVRRDGAERRVPVEDLVAGDVVLVQPGERIPADGRLLRGRTSVDQSAMTGESVPVDKEAGDRVFAATLNGQGAVEIEVLRPASDSALARMVHLVEEAQTQRAPSQRLTDWFGRNYTLGVLVFSAAVLLGAWLGLGESFRPAFYRAMTVLVVASPCAVVISIPAAILTAITSAARSGVLFKGGAALEICGQLRSVAFDKTGTLTVGRPRLVEIVPAAGIAPDELLALAAAAEGRSEHPLAQAVLDGARERGLETAGAEDVEALVGRGLRATVAGRTVLVGKPGLFDEAHLDREPDVIRAADRLRAEGRTVLFAGTDERLLGALAVADTLRPGTADALAALRTLGISRLVMLTGDNAAVARTIAAPLGLDFEAELLPEDKLERIRTLRRTDGPVAMVGDGINDAPALALADLGISLGKAGTDVALETADVVLVHDDLRLLPYAVDLARRARTIVVQNLVFAFSVMGLLLAATFVAPLPLPVAVAGHEGSTVLVILNGLRLLSVRRPRE